MGAEDKRHVTKPVIRAGLVADLGDELFQTKLDPDSVGFAPDYAT